MGLTFINYINFQKYRVVANEGQIKNGLNTLKIRFFDNLICMYAIYTSIRFIRNIKLSNKHHCITSKKVKRKLRKSSEKNILLIFHTLVVLHFSNFWHLI